MNLSKVGTIAVREFLATAATKAFIFGILALPAIGGLVILLASMGLFNSPPPSAEGTILILDQTRSSFVAQGLERAFSPEAIRAQREALSEQMDEALENIPLGSDEQKEMGRDMAVSRMVPSVLVERLDPTSDLEAQKARVKATDNDVFLLLVVDENSVAIPYTGSQIDALPEDEREDARRVGSIEVFQNKDLRAQVYESLRNNVRDLIVSERIAREGLDPARIDELRRAPNVAARTLTDEGETQSSSDFAQFLPIVFFMLLWMSVMSGGQYLLMSTIEEKSTRVMEVLLSAISPTELLVGKIVGQGAVGLLILLIYGGMGVFAADYFDLLALIPTRLLVWAMFYFFVAYAFFASLMAAAGSAVSDMREAQSLISPIMMLLMIPVFMIVPISQNPTGIVAVVSSYFPPMTPFIMVLRMCQPGVTIPMWELVATTAVALLGVFIMVFAAVKIFRVGVLMYGKPPSFLGLLKWIRYA